jgi:hypothetical protein
LWLEYHRLGGAYTRKQRVHCEMKKFHDLEIDNFLPSVEFR